MKISQMLKVLGLALLIAALGSAIQAGSPSPPAGMVLIPAGSFEMGDNFNEGYSDERPVHTVMVSGFYMDKFEVTKELWDEVADWAGDHGYDIRPEDGDGKAPDHPVLYISWYEAVKCANARSEKEGLTPAYYTDSSHSTGYRRVGTAPVGTYSPNGYGVYDMAGNVLEWVWDWYDSDYYEVSPQSDPRGSLAGSDRVSRGGSWYNYASFCRVALRFNDRPGYSGEYFLGFRLVRTAP